MVFPSSLPFSLSLSGCIFHFFVYLFHRFVFDTNPDSKLSMFINYFLEASETIKKIKISVDHLQLLHANIVSFHLKNLSLFD